MQSRVRYSARSQSNSHSSSSRLRSIFASSSKSSSTKSSSSSSSSSCSKKISKKISRRVTALNRALNDDSDDGRNGDETITIKEGDEAERERILRIGTNNNSERRETRRADSTDFMATFLTRRFGLKGGLAWLALLTFGVVSEQLKTRRETREERENTKSIDGKDRMRVRMSDTISFVEIVKGGGEFVRQGFLCGANVSVKNLDTNEIVINTFETKRPIGFSYSKTRPPPMIPFDVNATFSDGSYQMRNGGRRIFYTTSGEDGLKFKNGFIAPNVPIEVDIEFTKVSIPPS